MSALTDILTAHRPGGTWKSGDGEYSLFCRCHKLIREEDWPAHVVEVISKTGLAVVELPEPNERHGNYWTEWGHLDDGWWVGIRSAAAPAYLKAGIQVAVPPSPQPTSESCRAFAAALLAAAAGQATEQPEQK